MVFVTIVERGRWVASCPKSGKSVGKSDDGKGHDDSKGKQRWQVASTQSVSWVLPALFEMGT